MFSLIITIISIALVAVLALATLYYGGKAFLQGQATSNAAKVINQGQQVSGAYALYVTEQEAVTDINGLLAGKYLKAIPIQGSVAWRALTADSGVVLLPNAVNKETCQQINIKLLGTNGIPKNPVAEWSRQCFGDNGNYSVLWNAAGKADLTTATQTAISAGVDSAGDPVTNNLEPQPNPSTSGSSNTWSEAPSTGTSGGNASSGLSADITFTRSNFMFDKPFYTFSAPGFEMANLHHVHLYCKTSTGRIKFSMPTFFDDNGYTAIDIQYPWMINTTECQDGGVLDNAAEFEYNDGTIKLYPLKVKVTQ